MTNPDDLPVIDDELDLLAQWLPLQQQRIVELGCGAARLARALLQRHPGCTVTGLEVDERQHAKNLAATPTPGLHFAAGAAEAIPFGDGSFDLALMLKSLHHVPLAQMDRALAEVRRVLRPGGALYVSEPIYGGAFNELTRLYNDEGVVRAAAQSALQRALAGGGWTLAAETRFATSTRFADFDDYARRMIDVTYAEHRLDAATQAELRRRFAAHADADGAARFTRPMHAMLLRRADAPA